jgi:predicted amidophosphoribosyltransferase
MAKKYNLGSKSDMRKFMKDFNREVINDVKSQALNGEFEVTCPSCSNDITVPAGKSICSVCGEEIDLQIEFDI